MLYIPYSKEVKFIGRNGYFKAIGIEIYQGGVIVLQPTTTKGLTGRCSIEIPNNPETLRQIAEELNRIANDIEKGE